MYGIRWVPLACLITTLTACELGSKYGHTSTDPGGTGGSVVRDAADARVANFSEAPASGGAAGGRATSDNYTLTFTLGLAMPPADGTEHDLNTPTNAED